MLYRGGFFAVGIATLLTIAMVTHPRSRLGKYVIGSPVLVWVGKRSYGLYLYHWTIFQVFRKSAGTPLDIREFAGLIAVTLAVTELSYQFIETPLRTGSALRAYRQWRMRGGRIGLPISVGLATLSVVPIFAVASLVGAKVVPDDITANLNDNEDAVTSISTTTTIAGVTTTAPAVTTTTVAKGKIDVLAVGDSVMLGSAKKLASHGITVDAAKNRQVIYALQIFNYYKSTKELGNNVVIHLGTNGITKRSTFEKILKPLAEVPNVIVVNLRVDGRPSEDVNNATINELPQLFPNVKILDWNSLSKPHPEWFASDGIHPNDVGQDNYVAAILQALGR